jgi:HEPN domain-containing protein
MPAERFPPDDAQFPYVHDLAQLLSLVEGAGRSVPESIRRAASLSDYAVETRYPGLSEPVTRQEYEEAVSIAAEVVRWAQGVIGWRTESQN